MTTLKKTKTTSKPATRVPATSVNDIGKKTKIGQAVQELNFSCCYI